MSELHYTLAQRIVSSLLLVSAVILSPLQASTGSFTKNQTDTEQVLRVGQLFSLVIGEPQEMPELISLAIRDLPEGAMLLHNRDGTLSFMWVPQADDIGNLQLDIVSQTNDQLYGTLNLLVADAERYEQLRQQQLFQATPPTPIPAPTPDPEAAATPDIEVTNASASPEAQSDPEETTSRPAASEAAEATTVTTTKVALEAQSPATSETDQVTVTEQPARTPPNQTTPTEPESVAAETTDATDAPSTPVNETAEITTLEVEASLLLPANVKAVIPIKLHTNQENATLRVLNLPKAASVQRRGTNQRPGTRDGLRTDSYDLIWTPPPDRSVMHIVIVQVRVEGRVVTSRRLQLVTVQ